MYGKTCIVLFLVAAVSTFAQTLSFDNFCNLQKKDLHDANTELSTLGWELYKKTDPVEKSYGEATWYRADDDSASKISFVKYYFAPGRYSRVAYISQDIKIYDVFMKLFSKLHLKKLASRTADNMTVTEYANKESVISVSIFTDTINTGTYYTFLLFNRHDFDRLKKD